MPCRPPSRRARGTSTGHADRRGTTMGRHAQKRGRSGLAGRPALLGGLAALLVAVIAAGLVWWVSGADASADGSACTTQQTVRVTVAPEVGPLVQQLLADAQEITGDGCA